MTDELPEERVDEIEEIRSHVGDAQDKYDEIDDCQNHIDRHEQTVAYCNERIQDLNQRISTLESEKEALEEELGGADVDSLRDDRNKLEERIEELRRAGVLNFEMEASMLLTLAGIYGLRAGAVCTVFADRTTGEFRTEGEGRAVRVANRAVSLLADMDDRVAESDAGAWHANLDL